MLQLPEYNDLGLNVIILTHCGTLLSISLPYIGLKQWEGEKISSLLCGTEAFSSDTVLCKWWCKMFTARYAKETNLPWQNTNAQLSLQRMEPVTFFIFLINHLNENTVKVTPSVNTLQLPQTVCSTLFQSFKLQMLYTMSFFKCLVIS